MAQFLVTARGTQVKRYSYSEIRHIFIDRELSGEELARRLTDKGCPVTPEYIRYLLRGEKKGCKPFGRKVRRMIARELKIKVAQLPAPEVSDESRTSKGRN